jgi:predicted ribosome quality control (RQC) complex YloA/Tae2 family protein
MMADPIKDMSEDEAKKLFRKVTGKEIPKPDLPDVVAANIAAVMRDRPSMKGMTVAFDDYLKTFLENIKTDEERREKKNLLREQLTNGRLALESLYTRMMTSIG